MSTTYRRFACSPERVFEVLADGWLFPSWVVGSSRMRDVDENWPAVEAKLQHSFGVWPLLIDDSTSLMEWDPPRHAKLRARGWPIGEAQVTIEVKPHRDGCLVRIMEEAVRGPGKFVPKLLMDPPLHLRNVETLRRLAYLAEGGAGTAASSGSGSGGSGSGSGGSGSGGSDSGSGGSGSRSSSDDESAE